jgi:hypothetical protein
MVLVLLLILVLVLMVNIQEINANIQFASLNFPTTLVFVMEMEDVLDLILVFVTLDTLEINVKIRSVMEFLPHKAT